jgi:hypothetical protein
MCLTPPTPRFPFSDLISAPDLLDMEQLAMACNHLEFVLLLTPGGQDGNPVIWARLAWKRR